MATETQRPETQTMIDAVTKVTTDVHDVCRGYVEMLDRAEDDLKPVVVRLHTLHNTHLEVLQQHVTTMGGEVSDIGSAMGFVHKSVATVRDWLKALDTSALPQIVNGEDMIVDSYTDAILEADNDSALSRVLEDQRAALRAQIAVLRD